jgi:hypothetical protein
MHRLKSILRLRTMEFWRARHAVTAVEFALILPLMVILMLGSVETARLIIFMRRVTQVSNTIVELLAQTQAVNPNSADTVPWSVTYIDLHFAIDSTMVIFPQIFGDAALKGTSWKNDISISMASVCFSSSASTCTTNPACTTNCTYANVVWNSGPNKRACGTPLTAVPDTSAPSPATLPTDVFGQGSIVVVDIVFNYTPIFGSGIFGTIPLKTSAYLAPRDLQPTNSPNYIKYTVITGDDGIGSECPGY